MSRDNWARLVEAVIRREKIREMFLSHSRSPSISTIASSSQDDYLNDSFSDQIITNDSWRTLSVSRAPPPAVTETKPPVSKVSNANATVPFPRKLFSGWYRRRKPKSHALGDSPDEEDAEIHTQQRRNFSLRELQVATDNFSQKNVLRYVFHKVYKGRLADGTPVAVKRFKREPSRDAELNQFQIEVDTMNMAAHPNVIHLLGYCITSKEQLLVYPFMVNGSVASRLRERPASQPPLNWPVRKRIALGSARGLAYLHKKCDVKIIHRDIKAVNILLDEDFEAVIANFELAKLVDHDDTQVTTAVRGTMGHIAPEYLTTGRCTEKTDVYAYGAFLLELITGRRVFDLVQLANDDDMLLFDWVKELSLKKKLEMIVDRDLQGNYTYTEVEQLLQLALLCTQWAPENRPKMSEIVRMLEDGYGLVERWGQWKMEELYHQELNRISASYIVEDDVFDIPADELSGPR